MNSSRKTGLSQRNALARPVAEVLSVLVPSVERSDRSGMRYKAAGGD